MFAQYVTASTTTNEAIFQVPPDSLRSLIAGFHINLFLAQDILPTIPFEGAMIPESGSVIYDLNGELLFERFPIVNNSGSLGFVDIGVHPVFGEDIFIGATINGFWNEQLLINKAWEYFSSERQDIEIVTAKLVAYNFPKVAVQFIDSSGNPIGMIDLNHMKEVPADRDEIGPNHMQYEPGSYVEMHNIDTNAFDAGILDWIKLFDTIERDPGNEIRSLRSLDKANFNGMYNRTIATNTSVYHIKNIRRNWLRYSLDEPLHMPCFEGRTLNDNRSCVYVSMQMVLNYFRYNYGALRIFQEYHGDYTLPDINATPPEYFEYGESSILIDVLNSLTGGSVIFRTIPGKTLGYSHTDWVDSDPPYLLEYDRVIDEIDQNHPVISNIYINTPDNTGNHTRTVAGYLAIKYQMDDQDRYLPLLFVYDPSPALTYPGSFSLWSFSWRIENSRVLQYLASYTFRLNEYIPH